MPMIPRVQGESLAPRRQWHRRLAGVRSFPLEGPVRCQPAAVSRAADSIRPARKHGVLHDLEVRGQEDVWVGVPLAPQPLERTIFTVLWRVR